MAALFLSRMHTGEENVNHICYYHIFENSDNKVKISSFYIIRGNTTDDTLVQDCGVQNFVTRNLPDAKALPYIKTAVKTMKRFEVLHFVPQDFLPEMDGILPVVAHLAKYFPAQICTPQSRK